MPKWSEYQDEVGEFFRALGLTASVNETIDGVRTKHDVDVVVRSRHAGIEVLWLVECKDWKTRVPKEKVMAFREIVKDVGADRGFLMAEAGYQSGALEAARFTNVLLTSLGELRTSLADELGMQDLRTLAQRAEACRDRYWAIDKEHRITLGLRPDVGVPGYSGRVVIDAVLFTVRRALVGGFPLAYDRDLAALAAMSDGALPATAAGAATITTPRALHLVLEAEIVELEERLDQAEQILRSREANDAGGVPDVGDAEYEGS